MENYIRDKKLYLMKKIEFQKDETEILKGVN